MLNSLMGSMDTYGTAPSEDERKRALAYAIRGLGQGLLKGAFSNQPGGIGMGLSEGLTSFGDNWRGSLENDEKKRNDRLKQANALKLDKLQIESARQGVEEGKNRQGQRAAQAQAVKAWSNSIDDSLQEATDYLDQMGAQPEIKDYWKRRFHEAAAYGKQAIQLVDGKEQVVPEFAQKAMSVFDEYEKETGDVAMKQLVLDRNDESNARHLGLLTKDADTGIERGDIEKFRSYRAKTEDTKDKLQLEQAKANISATRALEGSRERSGTGSRVNSSQDGILSDSTRLKMVNDIGGKLGVLFQAIGHNQMSDPKMQQLQGELGVTNPMEFHKAWRRDKNAVINAVIADKLALFQEQGGSSAPAESSVSNAPDPNKVKLGLTSGRVSKADAIRDLQGRGLSEPQIRQLYPFLFQGN